jgi:hypothetical protein
MQSRKGSLILIAALATVLNAPAHCRAQAPAAPAILKAPDALPAFDVVSIKPGKPGCLLEMIGPSPDGFHIQCIPLSLLIRFAYGYMSLDNERVFGEPAWARSASYNVDAKLEAADAAAFDRLTIEQKASMLHCRFTRWSSPRAVPGSRSQTPAMPPPTRCPQCGCAVAASLRPTTPL